MLFQLSHVRVRMPGQAIWPGLTPHIPPGGEEGPGSRLARLSGRSRHVREDLGLPRAGTAVLQDTDVAPRRSVQSARAPTRNRTKDLLITSELLCQRELWGRDPRAGPGASAPGRWPRTRGCVGAVATGFPQPLGLRAGVEPANFPLRCGAWTRTKTNRARTCRAANYPTPHWCAARDSNPEPPD